MTKIVYADPNISPDVWTPPRCVEVRPISEHPAFSMKAEKLPPGAKRSQGSQALAILQYFRTHPPADVYAIAADLGLKPQSVKSTMLENPHLFQRLGTLPAGNGSKRTVWGRTDMNLVDSISRPPVERKRSEETQEVIDYLREHGPATNQTIAADLGLDRQQVKNILERGRKLFRVAGRVSTGYQGGKYLLWNVTGQGEK